MKPHHYIILLFTLCNFQIIAALANPSVFPGYAMAAENVLIGCSQKGIIVSGNYRFRKISDAKEAYRDMAAPLIVTLPVPVPKEMKTPEDLISLVNPVLTLNGKEYRPEADYHEAGINTTLGLIPNTNLAIFNFYIRNNELKDEETISIQYVQPIIKIDEKPCACYVPWIPYKKESGFDSTLFLISFESYNGETLILIGSSNHKIVQQRPTLISVNADHAKPLIVEIVPSAKLSNTDKVKTTEVSLTGTSTVTR